MKDKFIIAGEGFATKKAVTERVRGILNGGDIGRVGAADERFLKSFFSLHPNPDKRTDQIIEVWIRKNPGGSGNGFVIVRHDGSYTDISYQKPLRELTGLDSHRSDVLLAMREAVDPQIVEFRLSHGLLVVGDDMVVDHEYPRTFDALVKSFLYERGVKFSDVHLYSSDGVLGRELSPGFKESWQEFHRENAVLRLAERGDNSKWGNRDPKMYEGVR